ncbi:hypothetical protein AGMMS50267_15200 [Spirochaetia bacterium]|nr:hypothetical protein AGMMS50267_15200 [Spirochaetia bacterium]
MTETGRVQAVSNGIYSDGTCSNETCSESTITVQRETTTDLRSDACFGCMNRECHTSRNRPPVNRPQANRPPVGLITAENRTGQELQPGQRVEIGVTASSLIIQILTVLCLPLLGFAAVYVLTGFVFPALGEAARAACGVLGLFAVAGILYLIRRKYPSQAKISILRVL